MRTLVILVLSLALRSASAQPLADDEARKAGRRLFAAGDFAGAVAAFDRALQRSPDSAAILSDLGWALYKAKSYARAESVTRWSIVAAGHDPKLRAAGYYNLGRIFEDTKQTVPALVAYRESERARPSIAARARLAALSTSQPSGAPEPLAVAPLDGPFATLAAACAKLAGDATTRCDWSAIAGAPKLPPPFVDAKTTQVAVNDALTYQLALRVAGGWYVAELYSGLMDTSGKFGSRTQLDSLQLSVFGATLELSTAVTCTTGTDEGPSIDQRQTSVLCGAGESRKPSCSDALPTVVKDGRQAERRLGVEVTADSVTMMKKSKVLQDEQLRLLGRWLLRFD